MPSLATSVLPIATDAAFVVFALVTVATTVGAFLAFADSTDKAGRYERCYATVNARITEGVWWLCRHVWMAIKGSDRTERALPALFAAVTVVVTTLIPAAALTAAQGDVVQRHALPAGAGALAWGCLLEGATLQARIRELARVEVWPLRLWKAAVVLAILDVGLILVVVAHVIAVAGVEAFLSGAAFVAAADLVSLLVGFVLCPWTPYPLLDP
jgi:hypothetical protein